VIDGNPTSVDIRAGSNGEGVGCVLAPPTVVNGGGAYVLLPGPAIHEAPPMPDSLAGLLGSRFPRAQSEIGSSATGSAVSVTVTESGYGSAVLCAAAVRDARIRAGTDAIGTPTRVVEIDAILPFRFGNAGIGAASAFKIEFRCDVPRTCPISKEIRTTDYHAIMRAHELTGLLSIYVHCPQCAAKERSSSGEYCFVGVLSQEETNELEKSGAFEKSRARVETLNAEMRKVTWRCATCEQWYTENDRPSECCEVHTMNGESVCQSCQSWSPCEQPEVRMEYS
jgi:hypothetical protein